jgi:hypothetical protein
MVDERSFCAMSLLGGDRLLNYAAELQGQVCVPIVAMPYLGGGCAW